MEISAMPILQSTLKVLTVCGCRRPVSWTSPRKRVLYDLYMYLILFFVHTFTLSQLLDLILIVENQDQFTDNFYMLLAMLVSCCKMYDLLMNRRDIELFKKILEDEPCAPVNAKEVEIQVKFDNLSREVPSITVQYLSFVEATIAANICAFFLIDFRKRQLAFRAWLPYNYSSWIPFSFTFVHQIVSLVIGAALHVVYDGLICGFLVHTCSQIEILKHRLRGIKAGQGYLIKKCASHHNQIYKFARMVNHTFRLTILVQFLLSTLVVCFNLYQMAQAESLDARSLHVITYTCCMLLQIFMYCWYGNEVKLKSLEVVDAVFGMDWPALDRDSKSILSIIMRRSLVPIEFTSSYIISVNLESFVNLLKTSYSAYNVLQEV